MLPTDLSSAFQNEISSDERLLWSGRPSDGLRLSGQNVRLILFSLMWGGFAIFWNYGVWTQGAPLMFKLFGLPFLIVGLYLLVGRFFYDAWRRSRTYYALTDKRALIAYFAFGKQVQSFPLAQLGSTMLIEHHDGKGSIIFDRSSSNSLGSMSAFTNKLSQGFVFIDHARFVFEQLQSAQAKKN